MSGRVLYVFTLSPRKRSKQDPRYDGVLRTHRFYAEYYYVLEGDDPAEVASGERSRPVVAFPARFDNVLFEFAKDVGGVVIAERRVYLKSVNQTYTRRVVGFTNEVDYRRHLLFALIAATMRKPERLAAAESLVLALNPVFVNMLTNIAVDRYRELAGQPARPYYILRVGRAVKVLYRLDR